MTLVKSGTFDLQKSASEGISPQISTSALRPVPKCRDLRRMLRGWELKSILLKETVDQMMSECHVCKVCSGHSEGVPNGGGGTVLDVLVIRRSTFQIWVPGSVDPFQWVCNKSHALSSGFVFQTLHFSRKILRSILGKRKCIVPTALSVVWQRCFLLGPECLLEAAFWLPDFSTSEEVGLELMQFLCSLARPLKYFRV